MKAGRWPLSHLSHRIFGFFLDGGVVAAIRSRGVAYRALPGPPGSSAAPVSEIPVYRSVRSGAYVNGVEEVVAIEPGPWVISTSAELLIRLCTAVRMRRRVAFHYESHDRIPSRREVEPYGIVHMDGRWYMVGRCRLREDIRTFRLDRLSELEASDQTFDRPAGFDAKAYLQQHEQRERNARVMQHQFPRPRLLRVNTAEMHERYCKKRQRHRCGDPPGPRPARALAAERDRGYCERRQRQKPDRDQ
jgi:WYL domain